MVQPREMKNGVALQANAIQIRESSVVNLVTRMMAIPGQSCEELAIADFIRDQLTNAGIPAKSISTDSAHRKSVAGGQVGNLIVKLPGTIRQPRRLLMAHIDTVPLCVGCQPIRKGEFIKSKNPATALGGDNRAGAAVILNAILQIKQQDIPHPPLTLMWPVQEEIGLVGVRNVTVSKLGAPKLCFNFDGGAPSDVTIAATGAYNMDIDVHGIASHAGAHPELGVSASGIAGLAIEHLVSNGWHGLVEKQRRKGTSNIGMVEGGGATNVVTPHVRLRAEARSHDPKFRARIVNEFRRAFERAARLMRNAAGQAGRVEFSEDLRYESFKLKRDEPCVKTAASVIRQLGMEPNLRLCNGGLDANWMTAHGFPTVTLGCGQQGIHTIEEELHVPSFLKACRVGLMLATGTE